MKLTIDSGLDAKSWDYFISLHPEGSLLQSWAWGEFQKSIGNKIWRLRVSDDNEPIAQLLVIKLSLGLGKNVLYAPRDLMINKFAPAHGQHMAMRLIVEKLKEIAPQENAILLRLDPPLKPTDNIALSIYRSLGFRGSKKSIQPQENLVLDISAKETNIMARMKPKTRYNIRLAAKKGVTVAISNNLDDIKIFNELNRETTSRSGFKPHSDRYYRKQLEVLGQHNAMSLLIAYYQSTPLAAILVTFFGQRATYLHGASKSEHKDKMGSYALHLSAIKLAQERGCSLYDMGGVDHSGNHPGWAGITRFKEGFGGQIVEYVGTLELPLDQTWYRLYKIISRLRQ